MNQTDCVVCGSAVSEVLDLKTQPLANNLLDHPDQPYDAYPLGFTGCTACGHGQLTHFVDPALLFRNYLYASGTSQTLGEFFAWFAANLGAAVRPGARILELACNDGSLLGRLASNGFDVTGVDPAANLTAVAATAGHRVLTGFFPATSPPGQFDVIIAMNVAAHTPDPLAFMRGVRASLAPDGIAIIQTSQALMIPNGEFDTIYHEHYSFYSVTSMRTLAERAGLRLEQTQLVSVHGTSFLFFLRPMESSAPTIAFQASPPFAVAWPDPSPAALSPGFSGETAANAFANFAALARDRMDAVAGAVARHRESGRQIAVVGVAAKALTFIRAAGIEPDLYLDEARLKVGRFVPGARHPITAMTSIPDLTRDTVFLIGAWNFAGELIRKINAQDLTLNHRYLVHLPQMREEGYRGAA